MAKNRHGLKPRYEYFCEKCQDRGYTWVSSKYGMMNFCDCGIGKRVEEKMRVARETLRTCRKISRDGFQTPIDVKRGGTRTSLR